MIEQIQVILLIIIGILGLGLAAWTQFARARARHAARPTGLGAPTLRHSPQQVNWATAEAHAFMEPAP